MKNKKGFTLVELLAVIAILAILVIIALPNVINMYNSAKKQTFLTEAKKVYTEAEKKYISSSINGTTIKTISSEDSSKLDMTGEKLQYCVILNNSGKVTDIKVSNGKWVASLVDGKTVDELTIDDLKDGNLDGYECGSKKPKSFKDDSWDTIVEAVRSGNDGAYNVGDIKEVDLGDLGKHNIRIANKSTPSECSNEGFSQTACGFVIEFEDIIAKYVINKDDTGNGSNAGGWPSSELYNYLNTELYSKLPDKLQNAIIDTSVVSSQGRNETRNYVTNDKMFLLSPGEIYSDWSSHKYVSFDTAVYTTRQLDYYKKIGENTATSRDKSKKTYEGIALDYWTRTASTASHYGFFVVLSSENIRGNNGADTLGVSPAFRIG